MRLATLCISAALGMAAAAPHGAAAATLPARAPGLWQSTTTVTGPDGQTLPGANNIVTVSCVDPATDLKFFTSGAQTCSSLRITGAGQNFVIDGACTQNNKPLSIHETLAYAGTQNLVLNAALTSAAGTMHINSALQWQGDCLAGMVPGDEGTILDGNFSRTDNITDSLDQ